MKVLILWLMVCLLLTAPLSAQDTALPATDQASWDVFLRYSEEDAATELVFINILNGEMNSVSVLGERFTLLGKAVIYYDLDEEQVKQAGPDASIQDHPFISKFADTERVDWVVSKDRQSIAWTAMRRADGGALSTATYVSDLDGADRREILLDGPRESLRVLPIAFSPAWDELIMAIQPDGISEHFAYTRHAGLFALNLADGALRELPDETGCYCAAGFGEGVMLRFPPASSGDSFEPVVHKLDGSGAHGNRRRAAGRIHGARGGPGQRRRQFGALCRFAGCGTWRSQRRDTQRICPGRSPDRRAVACQQSHNGACAQGNMGRGQRRCAFHQRSAAWRLEAATVRRDD